jgi:hypothetical protein
LCKPPCLLALANNVDDESERELAVVGAATPKGVS